MRVNGGVLTSTDPTGGTNAWRAASGLNYPPQAVSCPSVSLCVAVGPFGRIYSSTDPLGGTSAWKLVWTCSTPGACFQDLTAVSCPSQALCVGVDQQGEVITSTDPTGGSSAWTITSVDPNCSSDSQCPGALSGVSCPSTSLCVAVDKAGNVVSSTNPAGGAGAWSVAKVGEQQFNAVSCASPQLCLLVGDGGDVAASTNPAGGVGAWTVGDADAGNAVQAISCPSTQLCVAVDADGNALSSTTPAAGAGAWKSVSMDGANLLSGVSCASKLLCVAVGGLQIGQVDTSTNPDARHPAWTGIRLSNTQELTAVSCSSRHLCVAVDRRGDVVTSTHPTGGAKAWSVVNVAKPIPLGQPSTGPVYTAFADVSCASTSLCVAVGFGGCASTPGQPASCPTGGTPNLFVSTDPTGGPSAWKPTVLDGGNPLLAVSCPSTRLCVAVTDRSILTSTQPTHGDAAWKSISTPYYLSSVACPTTKLCIAPAGPTKGSLPYLLTSTNPTAEAKWKASRFQSTQAFNEVTCASPLFCIASDYGHVFASSYPTAGAAAWVSTLADPRLGPLALSCPSQSLCVGIDGANGVIGTGPPPPTRTAIKALLSREIKPRAVAATMRALLRHHRYTLSVRALTAGKVTISWSATLTHTNTGSRRRVAIATGAALLLRPGTTRISLELTARGRQLIRQAGAITVVAESELNRPDGSTVLASSTFTLRP